ncbi:MAG: hypothetical protein WDZ79_02385 [Candidatus Paceibacterota bacterium]
MKPIITIGLLIVIFIAGYVYVWPAWQESEQIREELNEHDVALMKVEEFKSLRDQYNQQFANLSQEQVSRMETLLPTRTDTLRLVMNLDAFATEFGIDVVEVGEGEDDQGGANEARESEAVEITQVSLRFEDNYTSFVSFLEGLESRLQLLDITSIDVDTNTDGTASHNYSLTLRAYSLQ